jgi:signal transduction histidine kinase
VRLPFASAATRWPDARRWTVRLRLTALYGALFLASGAVLLAITYALVDHYLVAGGYVVSVGGAAPGAAVVINAKGLAPPGPAIRVPTPQQAFSLGEQLRALALHQRAASLHQLLVDSCVALAIMAGISILFGWLVAGRALRPLRAMTTAAQALSEHNLDERLPVDGPRDELRDLATTFNALLARLEGAFDSQRRFVANASHELRTPLTLERAVVEVALADPDADAESLRAACQRVLEIGTEQEAMIEALLTLARSQRGLDHREPVDVGVAAADAVEAARAAARARSVSVVTETAGAPALGDPRLVERLVANLVDNAVRHNVPGGDVRVTTSIVDGRAVLRVANTGPVVPPEELRRLMLPFQRLGPERSGRGDGVGMGLSIVSAIASAHGAWVTVRARQHGGLDVEVTFPAAAVQPSVLAGAVV